MPALRLGLPRQPAEAAATQEPEPFAGQVRHDGRKPAGADPLAGDAKEPRGVHVDRHASSELNKRRPAPDKARPAA